MGLPTLKVLTWSPVTRPHLQKRNSLYYVETVGYFVVLVYMCLPAVSDVIADIQAVVEFRSRRFFKDDHRHEQLWTW